MANGEGFFSKPIVETEEILENVKHDSYFHNLWRPNPCTVAYLGTVAIGLTIVEMTELVKSTTGWEHMNKVASGRHRVYTYSLYQNTQLVKSWQDKTESKLTGRLDEIIGEMESMARQIPDLIIEGEKRAADERAKYEAERREYQKKKDLESRKQAEAESQTLSKDWSLKFEMS